ncbi:MAG: nuclear transport factor 2 family protein [Caulobacteraceae bacterium]|jgi:hypothetical protein
MPDPKTIASDYIALWNETDGAARERRLNDQWTTNARFVDPIAKAVGAGEMSAFIGSVHDRFPGYRFALRGEPGGYDDHVRLSWSLGPAGEEPPIEGSDVLTLKEGLVDAVIGFFDKVPAPQPA